MIAISYQHFLLLWIDYHPSYVGNSSKPRTLTMPHWVKKMLWLQRTTKLEKHTFVLWSQKQSKKDSVSRLVAIIRTLPFARAVRKLYSEFVVPRFLLLLLSLPINCEMIRIVCCEKKKDKEH